MRRVPRLLVNIFSVFMPALSPSMETGTIVSWKKKVGDIVRENDVFCTVQTDKAVVEYTNTFEEGYLAKILRGEGETVSVAETIALLVENADDVGNVEDCSPQRSNAMFSAESKPVTANPAASSFSTLSSLSSSSSSAATALSLCGDSLEDAIAASGPAVMRIAAQLDRKALASIRPTGKNGRFLKADFIGFPGFNYEENTFSESPLSNSFYLKSSSYLCPTSANSSSAPFNTVKTFAVHNFGVSDDALLQHLIRTMPLPKREKSAQ